MREENVISSKAVNQKRPGEVTRGECWMLPVQCGSCNGKYRHEVCNTNTNTNTARCSALDVAAAFARHRNVTVLESPSMIKGVTTWKGSLGTQKNESVENSGLYGGDR